MSVIAGIYARISQDRSGEMQGVNRQIPDCQKLAEQKGWTVAEVYTDNDVSASKSKPRPAYERMMQDLREGKINAVLVYDVDRLTRKPIELEHFIKLVESKGVALANVTGDIDLSSDEGKMFARIKGALARAEADKMGRRLTRQKQQRAEQGKPPAGGRYKTYGYTRDWQVVPAEAEIIRDAFRRAIAGESLQSIADHWTSLGVDMGNGKAVYFSTVNNVLKRALYAGRSMYKGEIVGRSEVEPIIDEATFDAAQLAMQSRTNAGPRGKNARKYLLSGIIYCGECQFPLGGGPTAKDRRGNTRHKYACRKAIGGCGTVSISGVPVERMALSVVRQSFAVTGNPDKQLLIDYRPQIDSLNTQIQGLQAAVKAQQLDAMDAVPMIRGLSDQRKALQRKDALQVPDGDETIFVDWDAFKVAGISEQKAQTNRVIERIFIYKADSSVFDPERIKIHMRKSKNIVTGAKAYDQAKLVNPLSIIDGFRDDAQVVSP